jgi:hypothetical protein
MFIAQVNKCSNDNQRRFGTMLTNFGDPFFPDIDKRGIAIDCEANDEDICARVYKRANSVILLLARRIDNCESIAFSANGFSQCRDFKWTSRNLCCA